MTGNPPAFTLSDIEAQAKNYRAARDLLAERVRQLDERVAAMRRDADPMIRSALRTAKAAEAELVAGVAASRALFKQPKTHVFHGLRVGWEKGKGKVVIADPDKTITLIRKHLEEEQAELLIKKTESVVRSAVSALPASDLKRIGVEISDATDSVIVRAVDSELDKMLDALLKADETPVDDATA